MHKPEYRRSNKRRMRAFVRFAEKHYGDAWHRSINTSTVDVGSFATCALAQLSGKGDYHAALKALGLDGGDTMLQHVGILPYNLSERAREKGWHASEVATLNRYLVAEIDALRARDRREVEKNYNPERRVWMRMTQGKRFIKQIKGDEGVARTKEARMSDPDRCAFALATGMRYGEACTFYRVTREDEVRYGFAIDPTEPDIFMQDLDAAWRA